MKKRLMLLLLAGAAFALAGIVMADKKSSPVVRLTRLEGKADEFILFPESLTTKKGGTWIAHKSQNGDEPEMEFVAADPKSLSAELMFDMFEQKGNVFETYVRPLEDLVEVDSQLKRPPMVMFVWGSVKFTGVIESLETKYTMFLPDGTPTRCTTNLKMKAASKASTKSQPCP